MATCRTCAYLRKCIEKATKEGYEHNVDFDPKDGCTGIGYKSDTNADRIRAMSDEELTTLLCDISDCSTCRWGQYAGCVVKEWLKQPAEVTENGQ